MSRLVVKIKVSGVTVGGGITAKLQTGIDGEFVDSKTVSISGNGNFYIKLLAAAAGDQTFFPLEHRPRSYYDWRRVRYNSEQSSDSGVIPCG